MPRQSRRSQPAPSRPAPARQVPVAQPQQSVAHPPPAAPQQPGLFGQMASTAAGVAVGSAVGHTIGAGLTGLFSGGSNSQPQTVAPPPAPAGQPMQMGQACQADQNALMRCLEQNSADITPCQYYMEALKACKASYGAQY
ncbi:hypothetical protein BJ742DRAFT_330846 [Cladochytrium replicatum]|nr:hypothetical protein BJ742DRAFT_330846 [Cladochytrium replicatum]